jgi:hypothetical protein
MSCAGYVTVSTEDCTKIVEVTTTQVVNVITEGPAGPTGANFPGSPMFIQNFSPTIDQIGTFSTYSWWDTSGGNLSLWVETGV